MDTDLIIEQLESAIDSTKKIEIAAYTLQGFVYHPDIQTQSILPEAIETQLKNIESELYNIEDVLDGTKKELGKHEQSD